MVICCHAETVPRCCCGLRFTTCSNRAVGRSTLFRKEADYAAFEKVLREAHEEVPLRLLAFCVLPNHPHLVVWPKEDNQLYRYGHWLTMTHTQRWQRP